jgi:hypothetical protein
VRESECPPLSFLFTTTLHENLSSLWGEGGLELGTGRALIPFFFIIRRKQDQMFSPFGTKGYSREENTFEFYVFFL